jgi:hypothetical protein
LQQLRMRPCSRSDVKKTYEYLNSMPRKHPRLEDKVRIGYLLHVSSDDVSARDYASAHDIRVTSIDLKQWKLELHINLALLTHPELKPISEYFGIICGNRSYRWTCLPMGWSYSPSIAQSAAWTVLLEAAYRAKEQAFTISCVAQNPEGPWGNSFSTRQQGKMVCEDFLSLVASVQDSSPLCFFFCT